MSQTDHIHIRTVNANDASFLTSLMNHPSILHALNELPTQMQDWTDAITEWLCDKDEEDFIVMRGNTPIGWLGLNGLLNKDRTAYLKMAALHPDFQGHGFGAAAVRELMFILKQKGINKIVLYTDQNNYIAHACYRKCGFRILDSVTQTMANGKIVPRYIMEADL